MIAAAPAADERVRRAQQAVVDSATSPVRLARALVAEALALTRGRWASVFELRSGRWARVATSEASQRRRTVTLSTGELPPGPLLVSDVRNDPHPISALCRRLGYASFALVPVQTGRAQPWILGVAGDVPGELDVDDVALLSVLAVTATAAARGAARAAQRAGGRAEHVLAFQQRVLEAIARGEPLADTLNLVCIQVESLFPEARCSVLLAAPDEGVLHHAAAPSLPDAYRHAIDGLPIAGGMGACGSAAAWREPVVVADTLEHPYTASFRDLAVVHDLRSVWSYPLLDAHGDVVGTFALYRARRHRPGADEVARVAAYASLAGLAIERHLTEQALTRAAERDPLTGLPNRSLFQRELYAALERVRASSRRCAVLFLDLDGFKAVNDSLGHDAGDRVLVEVADRFRSVLSERMTLARFGGDEFTVLVEDAKPREVDALVESFHRVLGDPLVLDSGEFFVTTAIGIAESGDGRQTPGELVRDADTAMYEAKASGRGRSRVFDAPLRERTIARLALETDLRAAIRTSALHVEYQPILDIRERRWHGVEALVRWKHPRRGLVPPVEFVPLAEETGVVAQLGALVLRAAAVQTRVWDGTLRGPVGVNVSPRQLTDPAMASGILAVLEEEAVSPGRIYVEVTESAVLENAELAVSLLHKLRSAGVDVVIDDFGTGYSSIARLRELPVSGVKIDKTFVDRLVDDTTAMRVVSAVVDLAHAFGLTVTAEGVETEQQLTILEDLSCDRAQGYLLSRPLPPERLTDVLVAGPPQRHGRALAR